MDYSPVFMATQHPQLSGCGKRAVNEYIALIKKQPVKGQGKATAARNG